MEYPKPIMKKTELQKMGFPEEYLLYVYRHPKNNFAHKMNPNKSNSHILFDTAGFERFRQRQTKTEVDTMPHRR